MLRSWKLGAIALLSCSVFLWNGCGSGNGNLRLANATPSLQDANLTLLVDGNNDATSVAYGTASSYVSVSSGSRHVQIEPTGAVNDFIVDQSISVGSGSNITVLAINSPNTAGAATTVVLDDENSAPANNDVAIRAVNASQTELGTADIYIVPSSTDITGVNPTASSVPFGSATSYQTVAQGTYVVIFTQPGSKTPVIMTIPLSLVTGQVRTVLGLDGQNGAGVTTGVLDDFD